jgi:thymidylate kinase
MLITFSGLDGAGKSTLVKLLKASLERRDVPATVSHMYRDVGVYALGKAALEKLSGRAARGEVSAATTATTGSGFARGMVWNKTLRTLVYPLDLLIFVVYRLYVEGMKGHILIMDRYFYDTLVDVSAGRGGRIARVLARLTPTPSVPVLLDISPGQAFARKGEHSVNYLERKREAYKHVFPNGGRGLMLEGERDVRENLLAVESVVCERMGGR